jgi:hypothetical protein
LITRETVFALTPARWATSRIVAIGRPPRSNRGQYDTDVRLQTAIRLTPVT